MSTLFTGSILAQGLAFGDAITAVVIGMLILAVYGFFQGWMGAKYGVSTSVLAREVFGRYGSALFGLVLALTLGIGWFGWQIWFFGQTLSAMFEGQFLAQAQTAMIWGGILMIATAFIGYRALAMLSFVAVPLILILAIWGLLASVDAAGGWSVISAKGPVGEPFSLFHGVGLVVGNAALGAVVFCDLSRYSRTPAQGGWATSVGYFFGGILTVSAGAAVVFAAGLPDGSLPAAMQAVGFGFFAFVILLFAQWTTNDNNLYTGALGLANVIKVHKYILVVVMGVIGLIIALAGIQNVFVPYLIFLGTYIPPIAGVMIADHWYVRPKVKGGKYAFGSGAKHSAINVLAIAVVIVSGWLGGSLGFGIGAINAIVLALVGYAVLAVILKSVKVPYEFGTAKEDKSGF